MAIGCYVLFVRQCVDVYYLKLTGTPKMTRSCLTVLLLKRLQELPALVSAVGLDEYDGATYIPKSSSSHLFLPMWTLTEVISILCSVSGVDKKSLSCLYSEKLGIFILVVWLSLMWVLLTRIASRSYWAAKTWSRFRWSCRSFVFQHARCKDVGLSLDLLSICCWKWLTFFIWISSSVQLVCFAWGALLHQIVC